MSEDQVGVDAYFVLTLSDPDRPEAVDQRIERPAGEDGLGLRRLDDRRFLLAVPARGRIRSFAEEEAARGRLAAIDGVLAVETWSAEHVRRALRDAQPEDRLEPAAAGEAPAQWYLDAVNARAAWRLFEADGRSEAWREVCVCQIDTGCIRHAVFGPWPDDPGSSMLVEEGRSFLAGEDGPLDPCAPRTHAGHGTRIASVIGGRLEGRFHGIAPRVRIVPYRATKRVVFSRLWNGAPIKSAIDAAVAAGNLSVINMSLGSPFNRRGVHGAVRRTYEAGIIVVAAAGNYIDEVVFPARYARTIAAAGITESERPWVHSARGPTVDVSAPADNIARAQACGEGGDVSVPKGNGTSYATALTSGAAALWLAFHRDRLGPYRASFRIVEAFRVCLKGSARRPSGWDERRWGAGILNAEALLRHPLPDPGALRPVA